MTIVLTMEELLQTWIDNQDTYKTVDAIDLVVKGGFFNKELVGIRVDAR